MSRSALAILGPSLSAVLVVTLGPGWALATATSDSTAMNGAMNVPIARSPDDSST